jgi:hypothetical protein
VVPALPVVLAGGAAAVAESTGPRLADPEVYSGDLIPYADSSIMREEIEELAAVDPQGNRVTIMKRRRFATTYRSLESENSPSFEVSTLGLVTQSSDTEVEVVRTGLILKLV